jgi:hypothetical protein
MSKVLTETDEEMRGGMASKRVQSGTEVSRKRVRKEALCVCARDIEVGGGSLVDAFSIEYDVGARRNFRMG